MIVAETRRALGAASQANVSIYAVDPRGLSPTGTSAEIGNVPEDIGPYLNTPSLTTALQREFQLSQDSLKVLSGETGGFAVLNQSDFSRGMTRIVEENSRYYLLGYYPPDGARDGKYRRIEVRVKRPNLTVQARKGYLSQAAMADKDSTTDIDAPAGASGTLKEILKSPIPVADIPLVATASAFRTDKREALVPLTLEIGVGPFRFKEKEGTLHDNIEVSAVAVDTEGKVRWSTRRDLQLKLRPQTYELMKQAGLRLLMLMKLPSGRYQVRMVVTESGAGRGGSLFYDLEIPSYEDVPLVLTPLVITSVIETRVPLLRAEEDRGKVLLPPGTRRAFSRTDRLLVFSEVYLKEPASLEVTTRLKSHEQTVVFETLRQYGNDEIDKRKKCVAQAELSLSDLKPAPISSK
jgi:hypothetical protein